MVMLGVAEGVPIQRSLGVFMVPPSLQLVNVVDLGIYLVVVAGGFFVGGGGVLVGAYKIVIGKP